jgi:hypothetical protein
VPKDMSEAFDDAMAAAKQRSVEELVEGMQQILQSWTSRGLGHKRIRGQTSVTVAIPHSLANLHLTIRNADHALPQDTTFSLIKQSLDLHRTQCIKGALWLVLYVCSVSVWEKVVKLCILCPRRASTVVGPHEDD